MENEHMQRLYVVVEILCNFTVHWLYIYATWVCWLIITNLIHNRITWEDRTTTE